jgi:hypothetical protein
LFSWVPVVVDWPVKASFADAYEWVELTLEPLHASTIVAMRLKRLSLGTA